MLVYFGWFIFLMPIVQADVPDIQNTKEQEKECK